MNGLNEGFETLYSLRLADSSKCAVDSITRGLHVQVH